MDAENGLNNTGKKWSHARELLNVVNVVTLEYVHTETGADDDEVNTRSGRDVIIKGGRRRCRMF